MNNRKKAVPIPEERKRTVRQEIIALLQEETLSAGDLSKLIGKSEKEIYDQLSQIQKSNSLTIEPAECFSCGFVFEERERTRRPGKCPKCRSTRISAPLFSID